MTPAFRVVEQTRDHDMKTIPVLAVLGALAMAIPQAGAVTLTNHDDQTYLMEILVGEGSPTIEELAIEASESISDLCLDGCILRLDNGEELEFNGGEIVSIRGGRFVLVE